MSSSVSPWFSRERKTAVCSFKSASLIAWYFGGFGLVGALIFVFFFSHKRVWAQVTNRDDGTVEIVLAGDANRNNIAFGDKFNKIADDLRQKE